MFYMFKENWTEVTGISVGWVSDSWFWLRPDLMGCEMEHCVGGPALSGESA